MMFTRIPPSLHTPPPPSSPGLGWPRLAIAVCALTYVAVLASANLLTSTLGLVPAGFGLLVTAGTYTAGLALALRDSLQDLGGNRVVLLALGVAAICSALSADPRIAVASTVAAVVSELADFAVYTPATATPPHPRGRRLRADRCRGGQRGFPRSSRLPAHCDGGRRATAGQSRVGHRCVPAGGGGGAPCGFSATPAPPPSELPCKPVNSA